MSSAFIAITNRGREPYLPFRMYIWIVPSRVDVDLSILCKAPIHYKKFDVKFIVGKLPNIMFEGWVNDLIGTHKASQQVQTGVCISMVMVPQVACFLDICILIDLFCPFWSFPLETIGEPRKSITIALVFTHATVQMNNRGHSWNITSKMWVNNQ